MDREPTQYQRDFIERKARKHGRIAVREGYADGSVRVAIESGREWVVPTTSPKKIHETRNFSIDWKAQA